MALYKSVASEHCFGQGRNVHKSMRHRAKYIELASSFIYIYMSFVGMYTAALFLKSVGDAGYIYITVKYLGVIAKVIFGNAALCGERTFFVHEHHIIICPYLLAFP